MIRIQYEFNDNKSKFSTNIIIEGDTSIREYVLAITSTAKEIGLTMQKHALENETNYEIYMDGVCNIIHDMCFSHIHHHSSLYEVLSYMYNSEFLEYHRLCQQKGFPIGGEEEFDRNIFKWYGKSGRKRVALVNALHNWALKNCELTYVIKKK